MAASRVVAQVFHQAILQGLEQAFDPPLGLRGVGMDHRHPQLRQAPLKLTVRLAIGQLLFDRRLGRRFVGRMLVRVERERQSRVRDVATKAIQCGDRAFIGVQPGKDLTARIVDVGHEPTPGTTSLEPVMMRAVQLYQLAPVRFPGPPRPMWPRPALEGRYPCGPQPAA